jgi:diketogulonate reductase-like aldo/keto reductase
MYSANSDSTISRRHAIKIMGLGAATTMATSYAFSSKPANSQTAQSNSNQPSKIITKEIPRTKERIPAIGLGTFLTFDVLSNQPRNNIQQVIQRFWDNGGRMIDVSPLYGMSEANVGEFAQKLGLANNMFIANKIWATGKYLGDRFDLMQVHSLVNVDVIVPLLEAWKEEGRIRYLGVTHHEPVYFAPIERWIERGNLDFIQVRYSIAERTAEERILPAAAAQGTAVLANMPFEKARLFELVKGQSLPDFAREIGCENWAQFFLKYVISHPAVTAAIPATTNPEHVMQNLGAMRGELPDQAMRTRMVQHMESIPGFDQITQTPWYPGKQFAGLVRLPNPRPIG